MIDPDTALSLVLSHVTPATPKLLSVYDTVGLTLAEAIHADADYPPFNRAMMDGFAICVGDAGNRVAVRGEIAAGGVSEATVEQGTAVEIMTGAACPPGTEAVVQVESVTRDGDRVSLPAAVKRGQNIAERGSECAQGSVVLEAGDVITPLALASITTFGIERVRACPLPRLAIITTGDELVPCAEKPGPNQIRNSNGPMLTAMSGAMGISPTLIVHAKDTLDELQAALHMANSADFVILTGAVSAGKYDSVPDALTTYGATPVFHKVTQRPGKPILFATRGAQLLFGLPGNPLSCHLGFHRYIAPAIRRFMHREPILPPMRGVLSETYVMKGPRTVFQLARAEYRDGAWRITPIKGKGSADIYTATRANALLRFEPDTGTHDAGVHVSFEWLLTSVH